MMGLDFPQKPKGQGNVLLPESAELPILDPMFRYSNIPIVFSDMFTPPLWSETKAGSFQARILYT